MFLEMSKRHDHAVCLNPVVWDCSKSEDFKKGSKGGKAKLAGVLPKYRLQDADGAFGFCFLLLSKNGGPKDQLSADEGRHTHTIQVSWSLLGM